MFDRRNSEHSKSAWRAPGTSVFLLMVAVWFAACGEDGPVEPRNQAPLVTLAMPNLNVVAGTADTIDVSEYFADPDGDSLTYFAESSDTAVAVAQVSGNGLAVHGVAQGRATVTVTARDPSGLAATQEFDVTVRGADRAVLVSLFEATRGSGWRRKDNWLTDEPIDVWQGVEVDATGRVAGLTLGGNNLKNTIPPILGELSGLQVLALGANKLSGPIPSALFGLKRLNYLGLAANELEGSIAGRVGLLSALTHLDLSGNHLTGPIPDALGNLTSLTSLALQDNDLAGPIPAELGNLTSLTSLRLQGNDLTGAIPAELGDLTSLYRLDLRNNQLTGSIPAELGDLTSLFSLDLRNNQLTGSIPAELSTLTSLYFLNLSHNQLTGSIPVELGDMTGLGNLHLSHNRLTGSIPGRLGGLPSLILLNLISNRLTGPLPAELGYSPNLSTLGLEQNELTGSIPPELGLLPVTRMSLGDNNLTGPIPSQLGDLVYIRYLDLSNNDLDGSIPPELGELARLVNLDLSDNNLAGPIPPEILSPRELRVLRLSGNSLTGPIPTDLLYAHNLGELHLADNDLTAPLPAELGSLRRLTQLDLRRNPRLSGEIPLSWTGLSELETLATHDTDLCAPADPLVVGWLGGVLTYRLPSCGMWAAYLVQAVQSREFPVPLVAGGDALLRVFPTAQRATQAGLPTVRATFYLDGTETHQVEIPGKSTPIPVTIDEGSLQKSANADIPGSVVQPGLEVVIEIDPEGTLEPELGVVRRIPESGRLPVRVVDVPDLPLTLVPFLWSEDPDSAILGLVEEMAERPESHEMFSRMRAMLPVTEVTATVHEPVWTSTNVATELFSETAVIRVFEQGSYVAGLSRYTGMMSGSVEGGSESYGGARVAFAIPDDIGFAQAVGGLSGLHFAPCDEAHGDRYYPYQDGSIGVWGYDARAGQLISPTTLDLMSRCEAPRWISDYHFAKAARFRRIDAGFADIGSGTSTRSLLLWGGAGADGAPYLEPAFVVDAPPASPPPGSDHEITGRTADGEELFSLRLGMTEVDRGDGGSSFVLAIPVEAGWGDQLARITLSGPGGSATLDVDTDRPVVIVRDPRSGEIRGILRGALAVALADPDGGGGRLPLKGLEMLTSRGIPAPGAW